MTESAPPVSDREMEALLARAYHHPLLAGAEPGKRAAVKMLCREFAGWLAHAQHERTDAGLVAQLVDAIEHARGQEVSGRHDWCDDQPILDALEAVRRFQHKRGER